MNINNQRETFDIVCRSIGGRYHFSHLLIDNTFAFEQRHNISRTSGLDNDLDNDQHFAAHGGAIVKAFAAASPAPAYRDLRDFGAGAGRQARMFKGFQGRHAGAGIDAGNVAWIAGILPWAQAVKTKPGRTLPFADAGFHAVAGISVFTRINDWDQFFYLDELRRVTRAGAMSFLTVSGTRVLERAETDSIIAAMLASPNGSLAAARAAFDAKPGFCLLLRHGHLTSRWHEYGDTFISEAYIARNWSRYFELQDIVRAAMIPRLLSRNAERLGSPLR